MQPPGLWYWLLPTRFLFLPEKDLTLLHVAIHSSNPRSRRGQYTTSRPRIFANAGPVRFPPRKSRVWKTPCILRAFWKFRSGAIGRKNALQNCADLSQTCRSGKRPQTFPSETGRRYFFIASSTATATATVAPTMGLLPMPIRPIISTCAGTEEEPANWASECMRPMVSVMP